MPTGTTPIFEGSDFYIHVPVKHTSGAEFSISVTNPVSPEAALEGAVQDIIDYLNAWPDRDQESEPVAARKGFLQQYLITSPDPEE